MKIFTAKQIKEWDKISIAAEGIASHDLMNRAAAAFVHKFLDIFLKDAPRPVHIFVGPGNNGGDGLAIGRLLCDNHFEVVIWDCTFSAKKSDDFLYQEQLLPQHDRLDYAAWGRKNAAFFKKIPQQAILVDALFGSGLNRPLFNRWASLAKQLSQASQTLVAVDIPSGLFADSATTGACVEADYTITFQCPKLAFFLPENSGYLGDWRIVDIGLDEQYAAMEPSPYSFYGLENAQKALKKRKKFGHKGTFGHAALVGGSKGMFGAMVLATNACLRSGLGLTTVFVPAEAELILQIATPEALCRVDFSGVVFEQYNAVGIGCGWGKAGDNAKLLDFVFSKNCKALLLDADALNVLSENAALLEKLPCHAVLTPHPKEFERLFGKTEDGFERLALLRSMAQKYQIYIVLKGAHTAVACPDGAVSFNSSGNAGMATGGAGDVLTGLVTGLLAQSYPPDKAAMLGVYLHGLAGDLAAQKLSAQAMKAGDLINFLGPSFLLVSADAVGQKTQRRHHGNT